MKTRLQTRFRRATWLTFLSGLTLGLSCQRGGTPPTVSEFVGCDDLTLAAPLADGPTYVCSLAATGSPSVVIAARPGTPADTAPGELWSVHGEPGVTASFTTDGRLRIELTRAALPRLVTVRVRSRLPIGSAPSALHVRLAALVPLPAEVTADAARKNKTIQEGIAALSGAATAPADTTAPADAIGRARLLHALADLEVDAGLHHKALLHFQQALELGAPAGLINLAASSARRLAFAHFTVNHDVDKALSLLQQHEPLIRMVAVESALALYARGVWAQERGELSAAVRYLAQAQAAARDLDEDETRHLIQAAQALVLVQQGLTPAAETVLKELLGELHRSDGTWEVCERMTCLNSLGWVRILEQESHSPGAQEPLPLLTAALQYRVQDGCAASGQTVRMNLARAELLLAERLAEASPSAREALASPAVAQHLRAAREHLAAGLLGATDQPLSQQLDVAEVSGRIAYLQSRFPEALADLAELGRLAELSQEPDYQFRALLGQALVNAALARSAPADPSYPAAALAAFSKAEALLDERLWRVPLTATRRTFLPRFTAGTAEFLDFLLSRGEPRRALEVARRAQVRGLVTSLSFDTLTLLPEPQRSRLMAARAEVVRLSAQLNEQPAAEPAGRAALTQQLASLLADLHRAGLSRLALRELQPGEALHLCHPLPRGELACFVADTRELQVERIAAGELQRATLPAQQSALLLRPFARLIDRARVLRVLPSAKLRDIDFATLPWPPAPETAEGGYLAADERQVVYALDLALAARPVVPEQRREALMLTNLNLQQAQKSAPWIYTQLQQLGWHVRTYSNQQFELGTNPKRWLRCQLGLGECPSVLPLPFAPLPGTAAELKRALPAVELAQLDTHAAYDPDSGWQSRIVMPNETVLMLADLLLLDRVPRWTVLMVCEGGAASQGADADDISLAQALLLRGGEAVVASTRPLDDRLSGQWAQALYSARTSGGPALDAAAPSLPAAFHAAQAGLRKGRAPLSAWSALRLFVP